MGPEDGTPRVTRRMTESHYRSFETVVRSIATEISRLAAICEVDFELPNVFERIIRNDDTVCGRRNPHAFRKMRDHLLALMPLENEAIEELGASRVKETLDLIGAELRSGLRNGLSD